MRKLPNKGFFPPCSLTRLSGRKLTLSTSFVSLQPIRQFSSDKNDKNTDLPEHPTLSLHESVTANKNADIIAPAPQFASTHPPSITESISPPEAIHQIGDIDSIRDPGGFSGPPSTQL